MVLVFVLSAAVQLNDPDPATWIALYLLAAGVTVLFIVGRIRWWVPLGITIATMGWAASIAPSVVGRVPFGDMFRAWEMRDIGIEESREMYGLLIVAAWMLVLALRAWQRSTKRS